MENDAATVLKIELDLLVKELRALREGPRKAYAGRLDRGYEERYGERLIREVSVLDELQPLFDSAVEVLRLTKEPSQSGD